MQCAKAIEVHELTRRFGDFIAVDRVSFDLFAGEVLGYLGANGAGKSTTIRMLCGLLRPTSGQATVGNIDITLDPEAVKRVIGYMSQKFSLYLDLTVEENLEFFGGTYGLHGRHLKTRSCQVLSQVDLLKDKKKLVADLPMGFRQRLALACAILHQPRILFLDEPTAGVDPISRRAFWMLVRSLSEQGTSVLVTTHYMDEAEFCDRVGLMVDGRLEALETPARLKSTYVPGQLFDIRGLDQDADAKLHSIPGVVQVEPFGAGFHLRVEGKELDSNLLQRELQAIGFSDAVVEPLEPNLEDVFLEVVGRSRHSSTIETAL